MERYFRVRDTGQWVAPAFKDGRDFEDDGAELADRVAVALGLSAGDLEVVDTKNFDPRGEDSAKFLAEPVPEPEPPKPDPIKDPLRAILAKEDEKITPDELKVLTLYLARRLV